MASIYVDIDLFDFDTEELIEEIERRGYEVGVDLPVMPDVIWRYKAGYIKDAMVELERLYPELYGISKLVGEK
jgi:hypothetical protein